MRWVLEFGRRERIRTSDPLVPNQLRYQAALLAENGVNNTAKNGGRQPIFIESRSFADKTAKNVRFLCFFTKLTTKISAKYNLALIYQTD